MAQELADGEFWLPPEFLNDEDILMDFTNEKSSSRVLTGCLDMGASGSYRRTSDLGSPVESVTGSTETVSDEEDYLNGLTQKFANTSVNGDCWKSEAKSTRVMAGSPQSTLCGCKNGSSNGSPNCSSPESMATEAHQNQPSWDLLYAAAREVARMRMVEEAASRYYNPNPAPVSVPGPSRKAANPSLHYQQLQVAQFQLLKQQQIAKQQYLQLLQSRARNEIGNGLPVTSSAWPTPQQAQQQPPQRPSGSGMRAVFLGNPNSKRESSGTGVFLPRQPGASSEPLKKRGCSTVLLPDRVVKALDLNLEAIGAESKLQSRCSKGSLASDYDAEILYRRSVMMAQQRRNSHRQQPAAMAEFRLPQEWTY